MSLRVKEIFRTLQGEGRYTGYPCTLVRLSGCNLRCAWCDTAYAYQGGKRYGVETLAKQISKLRNHLVLITGGEPLAHSETPELLRQLVQAGHRVILETNGSLDLAPVPMEVIVVLDFKCPSSGEHRKNLWSNLAQVDWNDEIKLVIADTNDYRWAKAQIQKRRLDQHTLVNLSPVAGRMSPEKLAGWILRDRLPVRLNLQLHKLLWPEGENQA